MRLKREPTRSGEWGRPGWRCPSSGTGQGPRPQALSCLQFSKNKTKQKIGTPTFAGEEDLRSHKKPNFLFVFFALGLWGRGEWQGEGVTCVQVLVLASGGPVHCFLSLSVFMDMESRPLPAKIGKNKRGHTPGSPRCSVKCRLPFTAQLSKPSENRACEGPLATRGSCDQYTLAEH